MTSDNQQTSTCDVLNIQANPYFQWSHDIQWPNEGFKKKTPPIFAPKGVGTKQAHTVFILDSSSSMQNHKDATISGFNEFLQTQKDSKIKTYVSLYTFNGSDVKCVHDRVAVKSVEPLTSKIYQPSGCTNLLDAMGHIMQKVNEQLGSVKKKKRDIVTIITLTDGEENSSRTYNNSDIKAMIEKAEGKNWAFMFLGANVDAFSLGMSLGFGKANTIQYSTSNIDATIRFAGRMSSDISAGIADGASVTQTYTKSGFTDDERLNVK